MRRARFKQKLSKENTEVELSAANIEFEGGLRPQNGRIYLTVDGFERAFLFKCAFAQGALTPLKDDTRVRVVAARYVLPSTKIPVVIEIDSKSQVEGDEDALQSLLVEVKFDRAGQGNFEKAIGSPFHGLREQAIEYKSRRRRAALQDESEGPRRRTRYRGHQRQASAPGALAHLEAGHRLPRG